MLYWPLVAFLWLVTHVTFRRVEVVGLEHIPADGPVIFVGNHPNSLLDPVLIITHCGRRVSFAAKDVLFRNPVWAVVFRVLGCVPIRRRQDHGGGSVDNESAFARLFDVLREGGAFGIFPEGISHTNSELAPLKTGAARIGLGAAQEGMRIPVVPCGLSYRRRERLRSRVLVQFGEPLVLDDASADPVPDEAQEREQARALTDEIEVLLRGLTINARDFETLRVLDGVRRLYRPRGTKLTLAQQAEIMRRFIAHYELHGDEADVRQLFDAVSSYLHTLDALGLSDHDLTRPLSRRMWIWRIARHLFFLFVLLPFALPGAVVHAPVLALAVFAGGAGAVITKRKDIVGVTKMASATGLVIFVYGLILAGIGWFLPFPTSLWVGAATLAGLLFSGWALIRVLERQSVIRRSFSALTTLLQLRTELGRLRGTRDKLRAEILQLIDKYYDDERIIPRDAQR